MNKLQLLLIVTQYNTTQLCTKSLCQFIEDTRVL